MKRVLKGLARLLIRVFFPCHGCVREGDCKLYNIHNAYCGDWGLSYYEKRKEVE